jgi:hypothetical protein
MFSPLLWHRHALHPLPPAPGAPPIRERRCPKRTTARAAALLTKLNETTIAKKKKEERKKIMAKKTEIQALPPVEALPEETTVVMPPAQALVPAENGDYPALVRSPADIRELVEEIFSDPLSPPKLDMVKIPGAGGKFWELPSGASVASFSGVILGIQNTRAFWTESTARKGQPPSCVSADAITGKGDPGGECALCPHTEWGTGKDDRGTACSPRKIVYVLPQTDILPLSLALPVTSFNNLKAYERRLANQGKQKYDVSTAFTLTVTLSKNGIQYTQAQFAAEAPLEAELAARAKAYAKLLLQLLGHILPPLSEAESPLMPGVPGTPVEINEDDIPF